MTKRVIQKRDPVSRGSVLVPVVLVLLLLGILIPALVTTVRKEATDTQSETLKSRALHLAEAGQDRGAWKLRESDAIWQAVLEEIPVEGYQGDVEFTDVAGGRYKVTFSVGGTGLVEVVSRGRADGSSDVRAIRAVYSKGAPISAVSVQGGIQYRPNLHVHWGPVVTYTSIDQAPMQFYPRKFSAGQIVGRDTVNDADNGAMPGEKWDQYDYAAFYDLGAPPTIDLDKYRALAKASEVPVLRRSAGNAAAAHDTSNGYHSGYYTESVRINPPGGGGNYSLDCSTCVIFIEGAVVQFPHDAWLRVGALVVTGNVDFNARSTDYNATIPTTASQEYQHNSLGTFFEDQGWVDGGTALIADAGMHGFLYAGGTVTNAGGNSVIVGAIYVVGEVTVNTMTVYYDEAVAEGVEMADAPVRRVSWDEVVLQWE